MSPVGTCVRSTAIDELVRRFLSAGPKTKRQIISLGAGSDTRYFRLQTSSSSWPQEFIYHELDFPEITASKIKIILKGAVFGDLLPGPLDISNGGAGLHSPAYHIHPIDLRSLASSGSELAENTEPIALASVDVSLPTLLISECCLVYLDPTAADAVIGYFNRLFSAETPLGLILYEPINPFDSFGEVMVSNLAARGIVLQTLQKYHSLSLQTARLRGYKFSNAQGADINTLWEHWISGEEKERIAQLEMVDEVEEWRLLAQHYCIVWGWRGLDQSVWERWTELQDNGNVIN